MRNYAGSHLKDLPEKTPMQKGAQRSNSHKVHAGKSQGIAKAARGLCDTARHLTPSQTQRGGGGQVRKIPQMCVYYNKI